MPSNFDIPLRSPSGFNINLEDAQPPTPSSQNLIYFDMSRMALVSVQLEESDSFSVEVSMTPSGSIRLKGDLIEVDSLGAKIIISPNGNCQVQEYIEE